jgi:hypothetical protein
MSQQKQHDYQFFDHRQTLLKSDRLSSSCDAISIAEGDLRDAGCSLFDRKDEEVIFSCRFCHAKDPLPVFEDSDNEHPSWQYVCGCGVSSSRAETQAIALDYWNILQKS